jgi:prepilin-type processing-associated H-X9-DG protein
MVFPQSVRRKSAFNFMLPDLEQVVLYNSINFSARKSLGVDGLLDEISANHTASRVILRTLLCPSDTPTPPHGNTSYAFNVGSGYQQFGVNGVFPQVGTRSIAPSDVTDGLSNTIAMSEWVLSKPYCKPIGTIFYTEPALLKPTELDEFSQKCLVVDVKTAGISSNQKGFNWMNGDLGETLYNHILSPNNFSCTNGGMVQYGAYTAGSMHDTGCHSLFADGHVSYVTNPISQSLWRALGSRNGSEVIGSDY